MGRRSLDDALTPEEEAFYNGQQKSKGARRSPKVQIEKPEKEQGTVSAPPIPAPSASSDDFGLPPGLASLNTRIDPVLSTALLRASMDRKLRRHPRFTMRFIVEDALAAWLAANGYLTQSSPSG